MKRQPRRASDVWVPTLAGSTTAGTQTYAVMAGFYCVDGETAEIWGNIGLSAKDGTTAGNLIIKGLPIPSRAGFTTPVTLGYTRNFDLDVAGGFYTVQGLIGPSSSQIDLYQAGDNIVPVTLTAAAFNATTFIYFWARYPI